MQLNELLEKYTIKEISYHSKISENNLEKILAKEFETLKKVQTLGFISILEREYKVELSELHTEAMHYYSQFSPHRSNKASLSSAQKYEKQEKSRGFSLIIILLLGYASWYFFTQFDKRHLSELLPFIDEASLENFLPNKEDNHSIEPALSIAIDSEKETIKQEVIKQENTKTKVEKKELPMEPKKISTNIEAETNTSIEVTSTKKVASSAIKMISIIPHHRLWFGLINSTSKKRDHFSVADAYSLDVSDTTWLVATSSASFSLKLGDKTEVFNNNQEHYFSMNKDEIKSLSKSEYVALGGWEQW